MKLISILLAVSIFAVSCSNQVKLNKDIHSFSLNLSRVNFEDVPVGEEREIVIIITNQGVDQVNIHETNSCIADFEITDSSCFYINPKKSCSIRVKFNPQDEGSQFCDMEIYDTKGFKKSISIDGNGSKLDVI